MTESGPSLEEFLDNAASRPPGKEVSLSIRDLIAKWGAQRRGYWYVWQIKQDLQQSDLQTVPSFETGWIDNNIRLVPIRKKTTAGDPRVDGVSEDQQTTSTTTGTALKVGSLKSAAGGVVSVRQSDSLELAQSLMMKSDFSQLPVMSSDRDLIGAVSWESIAQSECIEQPVI